MSIYKSAANQQQFDSHYTDVLGHWAMPYQSHRVATSAGETHVLTFGKEDGPPLMLLTGGNGIAAHWGLGDNVLAEHYRLYAPDIPGQPGWSTPQRPDSMGDAYAHWLVDLFDFFELESAHVLGISLGGWLALKFVLHAPARVRRMVLVATSGIVPLNMGTMLRMMPRLLFTRSGPAYMIDRAAAQPLDPYLRHSMLTIYDSLKPGMPVKQPVFSDAELASIQQEVLLLVGDRDILIPAQACVARATRLMPHAGGHVIAAAGHILPSDQPELFGRMVIAHLNDKETS